MNGVGPLLLAVVGVILLLSGVLCFFGRGPLAWAVRQVDRNRKGE